MKVVPGAVGAALSCASFSVPKELYRKLRLEMTFWVPCCYRQLGHIILSIKLNSALSQWNIPETCVVYTLPVLTEGHIGAAFTASLSAGGEYPEKGQLLFLIHQLEDVTGAREIRDSARYGPLPRPMGWGAAGGIETQLHWLQ